MYTYIHSQNDILIELTKPMPRAPGKRKIRPPNRFKNYAEDFDFGLFLNYMVSNIYRFILCFSFLVEGKKISYDEGKTEVG